MNDAESERLADFLVDLKKTGMTLLVVEHHMDLIMRVCDELIVLNSGERSPRARRRLSARIRP